ncbi:ArsC family reductase [Sphingosinicella humi]|nr:ArsC family reductase [Sphingosinicella humi]
MSVTMFGIKNCDTIKKARAWLGERGVAYDFHDYKAAGIDEARLRRWSGEVGWETLLNRAGTTFRKLPDAEKAGLDEDKAVALMIAQPSMIKRPVLEAKGKLLVGFDRARYEAAFG